MRLVLADALTEVERFSGCVRDVGDAGLISDSLVDARHQTGQGVATDSSGKMIGCQLFDPLIRRRQRRGGEVGER